MVDTHTPTFASLLKHYRMNAGLTQEELAERADLSVRGVSALERGINQAPYVATLERLVEALGLAEPERAALDASISRRRGPEGPASANAGSSLPPATTQLVGREADRAIAIHLLRWEGLRLITLTGPGGVGKTRLALEIASSVMSDFAEGAFFIPLSAISDADMVPATLAAALGLLNKSGRSPLDTLIDHLRNRELLLLLDNFEQVADAALAVAELLASCPKVKIIVTSRSPLHLSGERELEVPPLLVPHRPDACVQDLKQYPSIALFLQRAQAVRHDFDLTQQNSGVIAQICIRLDGLPLAIELAAAWIKVLAPGALLSRLDQSLQILVGQNRDVADRQHTMRNTVAWSYDLLPPDDQALFRQLAVFTAGFEVEAVQAVCQNPGPGGDVLGTLSSLLDKSLLTISREEENEPRFGLLEVIREYADERLAESGQASDIQWKHADYYLKLIERAEPELRGPEQQSWQKRLDREHDNFRTALRWALESEEDEIALRLSGALWWFWYVHGYLTEGLRWVTQALEKPGGTDRTRGRALRGAGVLAVELGQYETGQTFTEQALSIFQSMGEKRDVATALVVLANIAKYQGDYYRTSELLDQSLAMFREVDDKRSIAVALNNLANSRKEQEAYSEAAALYEESLSIKRVLEDNRGIAVTLNNLGTCFHAQGDYAQARRAAEESLQLFRILEDKDIARALDTLGRIALDQDDDVQAMELYQEGLRISRLADDKDMIAFCLEGVGRATAGQGDWMAATQLYSAVASLRHESGIPLSPAEESQRERYLDAAHAHLDGEFDLAWQPGIDMPLEQALTLALTQALPSQFSD